MLVSEWVINRIGLVDFWYYDEEEFYFSDGRMLLRGANGSGKSVTMQSFIPLLLDGNKSSERLDPFGTKARRLENYLLEENDGREERTGYLYMEFKRRESDTFLTIGIGMCAKRNKRLDSWHFFINDGRRIGKDFFLYKDKKNKFTLTKKELINRLGEGGQVVDSPKDYMRIVNDRLFGYETVEEYKELVDLLIQLRTPKLSKDFKPTVLNEILSNALQPLSEEDLRPMSEAIENMDQLKNRLEALKKSKIAAGKLNVSYENYNRSVLLEKAREYSNDLKQLKMFEDKEKTIVHITEELQKKMHEQKEIEQEKELEQEKLEKQKQELDKNDVSQLMKQQVELQDKIAKKQQMISDKEKQVEKKEDSYKETAGKQKDYLQKKELAVDEIEDKFLEMDEIFQILSFDEHSFMKDELQKSLDQVYSFDTISQQVSNMKEHVVQGIEILEKEKTESQKYEDLQVKHYNEEKVKKQLEREQIVLQEQEAQVKSEWIEKFYQWNRKNKELTLLEEMQQRIVTEIETFTQEKDFSDVKDLVTKERNRKEQEVKTTLFDAERQQKEQQEQVTILETTLQEWLDQKDPEPVRDEIVQKNREWLKSQNIPYEPFYKVLDFTEQCSEQQRNRLEEALLKMGLLDALVVPGNYKEQVLAFREGHSDTYIFSDGAWLEKNITEFLDVTMESADIVFYQEITNLLQTIGISTEGSTRLSENGFQIGNLYGTLAGNYEATFIGVKARAEFREKKIKELQGQLQLSKMELARMEDFVKELRTSLKCLDEEFLTFPKEVDIKLAVRQSYDCTIRLENQLSIVETIELEMQEQEKLLREVRLEAAEICRHVYVRKNLQDFKEAKIELEEYDKSLIELKALHEKYMQILEMLQNIQEQLEEQLYDLDELRYDLNNQNRECRHLQSDLEACEEQLKLKDVDSIKEKLAYCVKRLQELPNEIKESAISYKGFEKDLEKNQEEFEKTKTQQQKKIQEVALSECAFTDEYALKYVNECDLEGSAQECADFVVTTLQELVRKTSDEYREELQERFFKYLNEMTDFSLTIKHLFQSERYKEYAQEEKASKYQRLDIVGKYKGKEVAFRIIQRGITEDLEIQEKLVSDKDRELFETILAQTVSKKIRAKIYKSEEWVANMNKLMGSMNTSSGLKLSLRWKKKKAESEEELDTSALVDLLKKDVGILSETELEKMSRHFQYKVAQARRRMEESGNTTSFHGIMKDILDYRNWFEFQLYFQKTGENIKELTNTAFFTFSGGEKAMAMYVPLFSAVVAKYQGARADAPRLVSLDEAFAGVDENNISDMFRLMVELNFQFIINSQLLWGDCDTVPNLSIYQLLRPENAKYVSVLPYHWNGKVRTLVTEGS